ncbi:class I SAM-dependent methyltransferase [Chloroflexia bacterium SDU3-3]|nr:class I SAM-dependent methyltransferase [Chloroflexia bacterium SDU3-3]
MNTDPTPYNVRFEIELYPPEVDWTRIAYDAIYEDRGIRHLDSFYSWNISLLKPTAGKSLLDVACGEGVLPNLARRTFGLEAYGTDISLAATRIGADEGKRTFSVAVGEKLPFASKSFDYVTCIGSLEHFLDVEAGMREMSRVLKDDGVACILVPNTYSLLNNIYKAWKTGMSTVDTQPLQRYASRGEWAMLLERNDFEIVGTTKYDRERPLSLNDAIWYTQHWRELVKLALTPFIPINLANSIVYLCKPKRA